MSRLVSELLVTLLGDEVFTDKECMSSGPSLDWLPLRRPASMWSLVPSAGWDNCFWGRGRLSTALTTTNREKWFVVVVKSFTCNLGILIKWNLFNYLKLLQCGWANAVVQEYFETYFFSLSRLLPFLFCCFSEVHQRKTKCYVADKIQKKESKEVHADSNVFITFILVIKLIRTRLDSKPRGSLTLTPRCFMYA